MTGEVAKPAAVQQAGIVKRLLSPLREFGPVPGLLYLADRALRAVSPRLGLRVYEMMVQPIGTKPLLSPNLTKNLSFQEIGRGHPDVARMPALDAFKERRFDQGARCLGVYRKGELIGYAWFAFGQYEEDEARCTYVLAEPAVSVFDFDLYVMPEHRLGIAFMAIWHGANQFLRERGVHYTFSRLTRFNLASRRAHAHLGWRRVSQVVVLQAWRLEFMVATQAPYLGFSMSERGRIRLRLAPDVLGAPAPSTLPQPSEPKP